MMCWKLFVTVCIVWTGMAYPGEAIHSATNEKVRVKKIARAGSIVTLPKKSAKTTTTNVTATKKEMGKVEKTATIEIGTSTIFDVGGNPPEKINQERISKVHPMELQSTDSKTVKPLIKKK